MAMPEPNRVMAQEVRKIRTTLERIVHMMANWSSQPEARMAKAPGAYRRCSGGRTS